MNYVTNETARRLKSAGFPQPESDIFQVWYTRTQTIIQVVHFDNEQNAPVVYSCGSAYYERRPFENLVYAPTATDILRELDENHFLTTLLDGRFCVALFVGSGDSIHNNPAEACAAAWLALNEKEK